MLPFLPLPQALGNPAALHGASAFTTVRIQGGAALLWPQHHARLSETCTLLGLPAPAARLPELPTGAHLLRVTVTEDGTFHTFRPLSPGPRPEGGVDVQLTGWQVHPQLAAHKTGNYLPYRLAGAEAAAAGAFEGWLRLGDTVCDGSRTAPVLRLEGELGGELGGELVVPAGGLPSVTRAHWLRGQAHTERPVALAELRRVTHAWICGSGVGVVPVRGLWLGPGERRRLEVQWPQEADEVTSWPEG